MLSEISPNVVIEENFIKTWPITDEKTVMVDNSLQCCVIDNHNHTSHVIPACNIIGMPKNVTLAALTAFLSDTWVTLVGTGKEAALRINSRLKGGSNITIDSRHLWPNGIIPYEIDMDKYPLGSAERQIILEAIATWQQADVGWKFVPCTEQHDVLIFGEDPEEASFKVGYQGGLQFINCFVAGVLDKSTVMREIGRHLGLYYEQQRYDWYKYMKAPAPGHPDIYPKTSIMEAFGIFDIYSIMLLPEVRLDDSQQITAKIALLDEETAQKIGCTEQLSAGDIKAARYLYHLQKEASVFHQTQNPASYLFSSAAAAAAETAPPISVSLRIPEWQIIQDRGDECYEDGNYRGALLYYETLCNEYGPYLSIVVQIELQHKLGLCYECVGEYEVAIKYDKAALSLEPISVEWEIKLHTHCGICFGRLNQVTEALACYQLALANSPHDTELLNHCGLACYTLQDYDIADDYFRAALIQDPTCPRTKENYEINRVQLDKQDSPIDEYSISDI